MEQRLYSNILGLVFTGLSGICFALASFSVKMSDEIPLSLVILVRSVVQMTSSFVINLCYYRENLRPKDKISSLLGFGALSFLSIYGIYFSFQVLPLGEATVVISTCPVFVALLERLLFKTPLSKIILVSGVMCSVGVVLLTHSGVQEDRSGVGSRLTLLGYCVVTVATVTTAATFIMVRFVVTFDIGFNTDMNYILNLSHDDIFLQTDSA